MAHAPNEDPADERLRGKGEEPGFQGGERDGDIGMDGTTEDFAGVGVEAGGKIGGEDDGARGAERVGEVDELEGCAGDGAIEARPEDGIDDEGGNGARGLEQGAIGEVEVEAEASADVEVDAGIVGEAVGVGGEEDAWLESTDVEVSGEGEPVAAVVPWTGEDEDVAREAGEEVIGGLGEGVSGVLHEEEGGDGELVACEAIEVAGLGPGEEEVGVPVHARSLSSSGMAPDLAPILSLAASIPLAVYWGAGIVRLAATSRRLPVLRAGRKNIEPEGVTVVVAAHNERARLAGLVDSLRAQDHEGLRFIVSLDRCDDGSAAMLSRLVGDDPRWQVVEVEDCPEGWAGKVHAVHRALEASRDGEGGGWWLFLDADVRPERGCIGAAVAAARTRGLDLLSLVPRLTAAGWREAACLPAAGMELFHQYPLLSINRAKRPRAFANGQFMLIRREAYDKVGTHEAVKDELLEDLALARRARDHGLRMGTILAGPMLRMEAYASYERAASSWRRILGEACRRRTHRLVRGGWRVRLMGTILPLVALAALTLPGGTALTTASKVGAIAGLGSYVIVAAAAWRQAGAPVVAALGAPVGAWVVGGWMLRAARDLRLGRPTHWGGMAYERAARDAAVS